MQLIINTYGSYLKKNGDCFLVKNRDQVSEISVKKVDSIMIATSAYVSTDALKFAVENNVDVLFLISSEIRLAGFGIQNSEAQH